MASEKEVKEAFDLFDTDKDGKIAPNEIGTLIRSLGKAPSQEMVERITKEAGKAPVDFKHFLFFYNRPMPTPHELQKTVATGLAANDGPGKGLIHVNELKRLLCRSLGEPVDEAQASLILSQLKPDKGGLVPYKQFVDLLA